MDNLLSVPQSQWVTLKGWVYLCLLGCVCITVDNVEMTWGVKRWKTADLGQWLAMFSAFC